MTTSAWIDNATVTFVLLLVASMVVIAAAVAIIVLFFLLVIEALFALFAWVRHTLTRF